jgi:hypothetical protein
MGPGIIHNSNQRPLEGASLTRLASQQLTQPVIKPGTSGVYFTTKDAFTLTDGPTILISNDIEKISKFCVQQANIPSIVMDEIMKKIDYNNVINTKIYELESQLDVIKDDIESRVKNNVNGGRTKSNKDPKKLSKDIPDGFENKNSLNKITEEINKYRSLIKQATLNDTFIPNKKNHLEKWAPEPNIQNTFAGSVDEKIIGDIMALNGIDNLWKVLLMMGIGVFINHDNITYTEIMKKLADEQKLFMIIASSDYIYGTNYQFCHGYLSKDLTLTQEKMVQALGRIGRSNIQQTYSVRLRDDEQIKKLFYEELDKPEVKNMNALFGGF